MLKNAFFTPSSSRVEEERSVCETDPEKGRQQTCHTERLAPSELWQSDEEPGRKVAVLSAEWTHESHIRGGMRKRVDPAGNCSSVVLRRKIRSRSELSALAVMQRQGFS